MHPELPPTGAQQFVHDQRTGQYEARLRRTLDAEGQRLWEEIRGLDRMNAVESRPELEQWFFRDGQLASAAIRGRVAVLVADLAWLESSLKAGWERADTGEVREWLDRSKTSYGPQSSTLASTPTWCIRTAVRRGVRRANLRTRRDHRACGTGRC